MPLLRDPDISYYLRQERDGLILGPYEAKATVHWQDGIPDQFAYQLWPDDLDRLEYYISDAMERVPLLAKAGIQRVINGPIPYSPDGNPYIGPVRGLKNFFQCCCFSFGIAQSGGAGRLTAGWIVNGRPEWDIWSIDSRRFGDYATIPYTTERATELYRREYAIAFPAEEWEGGRPAYVTPLYEKLKAKGARFGARGGWERAVWFHRDGVEANPEPSFRRPAWHKAIAEEVRAVRERVGFRDRDFVRLLGGVKLAVPDRLALRLRVPLLLTVAVPLAVTLPVALEDGVMLGAAPCERDVVGLLV